MLLSWWCHKLKGCIWSTAIEIYSIATFDSHSYTLFLLSENKDVYINQHVFHILLMKDLNLQCMIVQKWNQIVLSVFYQSYSQSAFRKIFCHLLLITCNPKVKRLRMQKLPNSKLVMFLFLFSIYWLMKLSIKAHEFQIKLIPISSYICLWFQFALHCKSEVRVMLYIFYLSGWNYSVKILEIQLLAL